MRFTHPLDKIRQAVADQLRETLAAAMPQTFPGTLRLTCKDHSPPTIVDGDLTGADLAGVINWLNEHSGHGDRNISLTIPAGTETKVQTGATP